MSRPPPRFLKPTDDAYSASQRVGRQPQSASQLDRPDVETGESSTAYSNPYRSMALHQQRLKLPIFKYREHIVYLLERHRALVVVGETGCGKSTQLPQYLAESGYAGDGYMVAVTQPRRIAVVTVAQRCAEECGSPLGHAVGYAVRFDQCVGAGTRLKFVTDGLLIREIMADPLLAKYSVVVVDEAHERSVNTDLLCGLLRKIMQKRPDLKVIVSSATLDANVFVDFFNLNDTADRSRDTAAAISVEGRAHPVKVLYAKTAQPDYVSATVRTALRIHASEPPGDVLAFLTGMDEVESACAQLRDEAKRLSSKKADRLLVVPLYGAMPIREQVRAFDSTPAGSRKVVLATNIAEASITIPAIAYVIDCGFMKLRALSARTGIESLLTVAISHASAEQRAGRAGRIRPGKCYRLYPECEYVKLRPDTVPEMQRAHMAPVLLQMKALGVANLLRFHYVSRPSSAAMMGGLELLLALGAIDKAAGLTELGKKMAEFPLPPMHSRALLASGEHGCSEEMLSIVAMLQIQDVFLFPAGSKHRAEVTKRRFSARQGDHLTLLNVFTCFEQSGRSSRWCSEHYVNHRALCRAGDVRSQLARFLKEYDVPLVAARDTLGAADSIARCLVAGFFANAARLDRTGRFVTVRHGHPLGVYKGSALMYADEFPKWVIYGEVLSDCMRDVCHVERDWLTELAPDYYEFGTDSEIAAKRARNE